MPEEWYKPGRSIQEFHKSGARIRALIGGRGSGKTTGDMVEAIRHCWHIAGAKVYVLRKLESAQDGSTIDTLRQIFTNMGSAYVDTGYSLFKEISGGKEWRIPSHAGVEMFEKWMNEKTRTKLETQNWLDTKGDQFCSRIIFSGVPDASKRASRFRGYECSMLIFVEADELDIEDFRLGLATLRWKDAFGKQVEDYSCILDTNPPSPRHWIAKYEEDNKDNEDVKFWHIKTSENEHNLPPGYVKDLMVSYASDPSGYLRMVEGQYAESFTGTPVFHSFSQVAAVRGLPFPKGAYLVRGWDFGTTNATVWSAYWSEPGKRDKNGIQIEPDQEYVWDLRELFLEEKDTDIQAAEAMRITREEFPFWNDRTVCAGVLDYCDPAGDAKKSTGQDVDILRTYGVSPGWNTAMRGLRPTFAILNRFFALRDKSGNPVYRIDKDGCPRLYLALSGGYRYPAVGEPGYSADGQNEPLKGPKFGNFDHVSDAARYAKINMLHLDRYIDETTKPLGGKLGRSQSVNRPKKFF